MKAAKIVSRDPNAVLQTQGLKDLGIEIRLVPIDVLASAVESSLSELFSRYNLEETILPKRFIAFTLKVAGKPEIELSESGDDFVVEANLFDEEKLFRVGTKARAPRIRNRSFT